MNANGDLVKWAGERGWSFERTQKGHYKFEHPQIGKSVYTSGTPSDHRAFNNAKAKMKSLERQHGLLKDGRDRKRRSTETFQTRAKMGADGTQAAILHVIRCSTTGCDNEDDLQQALTSQGYQASNLAAIFRRRGWHAKMDRRHDLCPSCRTRLGDRATEHAKSETADLSQAFQLQKPVWDTRRRIVREINKVYVSPDIGYMAGEHDAAIAQRCGVTEATVAQIRSDLFGPVPKSTEMVYLTREVARLERELKIFTDVVLTHSAKLETTIASVRAQLGGMRKQEQLEELQQASPNGHGAANTH